MVKMIDTSVQINNGFLGYKNSGGVPIAPIIEYIFSLNDLPEISKSEHRKLCKLVNAAIKYAKGMFEIFGSEFEPGGIVTSQQYNEGGEFIIPPFKFHNN